MSLSDLKRHKLSWDEINQIVESVHGREPREIAIVSMAVIESLLRDCLVRKLVHPKAIMLNSLSFTKLVEFNYALGLLSEEVVTNLRKLNEIRNVFAHNGLTISFDTPEIKTECGQLAIKNKASFRTAMKNSLVEFEDYETTDDRNGLYVVDADDRILYQCNFSEGNSPRDFFLNSVVASIGLIFAESLKPKQEKREP